MTWVAIAGKDRTIYFLWLLRLDPSYFDNRLGSPEQSQVLEGLHNRQVIDGAGGNEVVFHFPPNVLYFFVGRMRPQ